MNKEKYFSKLCGVYDKVSGAMVLIGIEESLGAFTRNSIPVFSSSRTTPLNDLEIVEIAEINKFTGEIRGIGEMKHYDWKELYKFNVTSKATENEEETTETKEADKQ